MISTAAMANAEPNRNNLTMPVAFVAPEGPYSVLVELNVQKPLTDSNINSILPSNSSNNILNLGLNSTSNSVPSSTTTSGNPNHTSNSATNSSTNVNSVSASNPTASTPVIPPVYIPAVPGVPANADGINPSVAPPAYPSAIDTIFIKFSSSHAPNLFLHPAFLSGTKYGRSRDPTSVEPTISEPILVDQADSSHSSDDPSSLQSSVGNLNPPSTHMPTNQLGGIVESHTNLPTRTTLSPMTAKTRAMNFGSTLSSLSSNPTGIHSMSPLSPNSLVQISPRPRAAFKGSNSTFIKSSEGLPLSQSVLKSLYGSSNPDHPDSEERTFAFYTWNKTLIWTHLVSGKPIELAKLVFQSFPTSVAINQSTASAGTLDIILGFASGDLIYFDPFCARYTRLNKGGCVSSSSVSKVVWLSKSNNHFFSSHEDGTVIGWDKDREDFSGFVMENWPRLEKSNLKIDDRVEAMVVSKLPNNIAVEKRNKLNPVSHWRLSRKGIRDLAFSPDSRLCATVSEDGCLRITDVNTERLLDTYVSYFGALLCVCWSSDGRLIFTGGQDDLVTIYSPLDQRIIARCQGHASFVTGIGYDPWMSDERLTRFASVSDDCKLIFWDLSSASLSRPRLLQFHSSNSRRQSMTSTVSLSLHRRRVEQMDHLNSNLEHHPEEVGMVHLAPGRNEVSILQPVMVKEMSVDPLCEIKFMRDKLVIVSRSGQLKVIGRPERSLNGKVER
ncbi:catabolite repressor protein [Melampsora americana]|nr:catabolite repressor protein [Melampsora americana]